MPEIVVVVLAMIPYLRLASKTPPLLFDGGTILSRGKNRIRDPWRDELRMPWLAKIWHESMWKIFADRVSGWILSAALLHAIWGLVVLRLAELVLSGWGPLVCAVAFVLHPTAISAIALLEGHSSLLAGFWMTVGLVAAFHGSVAGVVIGSVLALASKHTAISMIPLLTLLGLATRWR